MDKNIDNKTSYFTAKDILQARRRLWARGETITAFALRHDLPAHSVVEILRNKHPGHRGNLHKAAVALGLKPYVPPPPPPPSLPTSLPPLPVALRKMLAINLVSPSITLAMSLLAMTSKK